MEIEEVEEFELLEELEEEPFPFIVCESYKEGQCERTRCAFAQPCSFSSKEEWEKWTDMHGIYHA